MRDAIVKSAENAHISDSWYLLGHFNESTNQLNITKSYYYLYHSTLFYFISF